MTAAADTIIEMATAGQPDAVIAEAVRVSRSYVRAVRCHADIKAPMPEKRGPKPGARPYRVKVRT